MRSVLAWVINAVAWTMENGSRQNLNLTLWTAKHLRGWADGLKT